MIHYLRFIRMVYVLDFWLKDMLPSVFGVAVCPS